MNPKVNIVAEKLQLHLQQEAEFLGELLLLVAKMRETLLAKTNAESWDDEYFENTVLPRSKKVARARSLLRLQIAAILEIPAEQGTVKTLAAACDPAIAQRLHQTCSHIHAQALELNGQLAANGSLAYRLWSLTESVLRQLQGDAPAVSSYRSDGLRNVA